MSSSEQLTLMYYKKLAFKVAMVLLIVGALNWLLVGAFKWNLVKALFGEGPIARTIYVLVGLAALGVMFDRDTYLPFLGPTVIPCASAALQPAIKEEVLFKLSALLNIFIAESISLPGLSPLAIAESSLTI